MGGACRGKGLHSFRKCKFNFQLRTADLTPNASMFPGVTYAAKGYFDALVRMGEMASESQGSKDLGESLQ